MLRQDCLSFASCRSPPRTSSTSSASGAASSSGGWCEGRGRRTSRRWSAASWRRSGTTSRAVSRLPRVVDEHGWPASGRLLLRRIGRGRARRHSKLVRPSFGPAGARDYRLAVGMGRGKVPWRLPSIQPDVVEHLDREAENNGRELAHEGSELVAGSQPPSRRKDRRGRRSSTTPIPSTPQPSSSARVGGAACARRSWAASRTGS